MKLEAIQKLIDDFCALPPQRTNDSLTALKFVQTYGPKLLAVVEAAESYCSGADHLSYQMIISALKDLEEEPGRDL